MSEVRLDGSEGEGGGQILRSALSLSLLTGRPFSIEKIRAGRAKPGLLRQHLTAVNAAAELGSAEITGATLGSTSLRFVPQVVNHTHRTFAIGTAGSAVLVIQTLLPPLLVTPGKSRLVIEGGTHNPLAPPWPFLERVFFPLLARMGAKVSGTLERPGFMPAGGGRVVVEVEGVEKLLPLELHKRGKLIGRRAEAIVSKLDRSIADRELTTLAKALDLRPYELYPIEVDSDGPGNAICLELEFEQVRELVTAIGERATRAERVATALADEAQRYLGIGVPVAEHLADQLLLPMAIAGSGSFRTVEPTPHSRTNAEVIARFLPVQVEFRDEGRGAWMVKVT